MRAIKLERMPTKIPEGCTIEQETPFAVVRAKDGDAFLSALSPVVGFGANLRHHSLIYRGQSNPVWSLIPTARRKEMWPPLLGAGGRDDTLANRLASEAVTLLTFCRIADRQGLSIPNHTVLTSDLIQRFGALARGDPFAIATWPPPQAAPALSLAQHYGLSTCLLDFTWNPYVAAYFAIRDHIGKKSLGGSACVWIVDDANLLVRGHDPRHSLEIVIPPASDNRTMQAQEGLFICQRLLENLPNLNAEYQSTPFESILAGGGVNSITKLIVEVQYPSFLLNKIIKLGYDGSRLFPGFEGAAQAVREHAWSGSGPAW
jgi:hypothetical protein